MKTRLVQDLTHDHGVYIKPAEVGPGDQYYKLVELRRMGEIGSAVYAEVTNSDGSQGTAPICLYDGGRTVQRYPRENAEEFGVSFDLYEGVLCELWPGHYEQIKPADTVAGLQGDGGAYFIRWQLVTNYEPEAPADISQPGGGLPKDEAEEEPRYHIWRDVKIEEAHAPPLWAVKMREHLDALALDVDKGYQRTTGIERRVAALEKIFARFAGTLAGVRRVLSEWTGEL